MAKQTRFLMHWKLCHLLKLEIGNFAKFGIDPNYFFVMEVMSDCQTVSYNVKKICRKPTRSLAYLA